MKCKKKKCRILFEKVLLGSLHKIAPISWIREVIVKKRVAGLCLARSVLVRGFGCRKGEVITRVFDKRSQT